MNSIRILLLLAAVISVQGQNAEPQQAPVPDPEAQRRAKVERERQQREREREDDKRRLDFLTNPTGTVPAPLPRESQPYIAPLMRHDPDFDWNSIPISEWLDAPELEEIPWRVDVKDATLRMDQRQEVGFSAKVQGKDLKKLGITRELFFLSGVSDSGGKWLAAPKAVRYEVSASFSEDVELRFTDEVFVQTGSFSLWLILYDRETSKRSVEKREIEVSEIENDPLPKANSRLATEIPRLSDREGGSVLEFFGGLSLPVANNRPLRLELISVLSAPEQWSGRHSIIRSHNEHIVATLNALSQIDLSRSSMSLTGVDIIQRKIVFEQKEFERLDWPGLAGALRTIQHNTVSAATLQAKGGAAFFRDFMSEKLAGPHESLRVLILISSSSVFGHDADRQAMKLQDECHCRTYHLRFRHIVGDVFDDLEKILKPLRPKTFNLSTPRDLRKALAEIMKDLAAL